MVAKSDARYANRLIGTMAISLATGAIDAVVVAGVVAAAGASSAAVATACACTFGIAATVSMAALAMCAVAGDADEALGV
jgi:hypothetical protein